MKRRFPQALSAAAIVLALLIAGEKREPVFTGS